MTVHDPNSELHQILTGSRPRKGAPLPLLVVPVLALGLAAGGYLIWREATKPPLVVADTSTCERLLLTASNASPGKFLVCSAATRTVYRLADGQRQPLGLAANTVYELPIDGRTRMEGLSAPDMRYGYGGTSCERLTKDVDGKTFLLNSVPVDKSSC
ncbi:MAG: hypothetical protein JSR86_03530 [Proteobacteria bacterium]|nr:hypothetical protein [Pseudomonadota bacterium]